jgi:hypothetical protein
MFRNTRRRPLVAIWTKGIFTFSVDLALIVSGASAPGLDDHAVFDHAPGWGEMS